MIRTVHNARETVASVTRRHAVVEVISRPRIVTVFDDDKAIAYRRIQDAYEQLGDDEEVGHLDDVCKRHADAYWGRTNRDDSRSRSSRLLAKLRWYWKHLDDGLPFTGYHGKCGSPSGRKPEYKDKGRETARYMQPSDASRVTMLMDEIQNGRRLARTHLRLTAMVERLEKRSNERLAEVIAPLRQFLANAERKAA